MPSRVPETSESQVIGPIRIHTPPPQRPTSFAEPQPPAPAAVKPLAYIKYRWVTVLFLGGFLSAVLAYTAWTVVPSKYTTNSMVRVLTEDPVVHAKETLQGRSDFATYVKTQAAMIKSNFVLNAALRDPAVAALPMLREQPDPARFLEEELKVEYPEGSEIIKISLSGEDPRAISMIVNAVQEAFFREVVEDELTRKKARLKQLEDAITRMQDEVKRRHEGLKQADGSDEAPTQSIPGLGTQIAFGQLVRVKETLVKIEADISTWEAEKASVQKKLANPAAEAPPPPAGYAETLANDVKMQTTAKRIESLKTRIEYLIKVSGDPELASVKELRQRITEAEQERERFKRERLEEYQKSQLPIFEKKLKSDLERCATAITQLSEQKKKMEQSAVEYQKMLNDQAQPDDKPPQFPKIDLRERAKIITEMIDKANLLRLEVNAPPRVRDFQRASVPLKKEMKKQLLATVAAGLMGFALVGLGVVLYESRVRRALSLADVRQTVIGPIAGVLPVHGRREDAATAEAIEKTRTQLLQQFARPGGKVIAVASAARDEGKTELAEGLAMAFARAGSRTLLVDFDLRTPSLHRLVGVENGPGLCEALGGSLDLRTALVTLPTGLMFLPAGKWAPEVRVGLTADRIEMFMGWLRQHFDCAIINTHALLSVAESSVVCRAADGVLLSVERHQSRLPLVSRAHEKLAACAPEVFGVVYQGADPEECLQ
jgi:capsular exopolysaccharide synthesis family protein